MDDGIRSWLAQPRLKTADLLFAKEPAQRSRRYLTRLVILMIGFIPFRMAKLQRTPSFVGDGIICSGHVLCVGLAFWSTLDVADALPGGEEIGGVPHAKLQDGPDFADENAGFLDLGFEVAVGRDPVVAGSGRGLSGGFEGLHIGCEPWDGIDGEIGGEKGRLERLKDLQNGAGPSAQRFVAA